MISDSNRKCFYSVSHRLNFVDFCFSFSNEMFVDRAHTFQLNAQFVANKASLFIRHANSREYFQSVKNWLQNQKRKRIFVNRDSKTRAQKSREVCFSFACSPLRFVAFDMLKSRFSLKYETNSHTCETNVSNFIGRLRLPGISLIIFAIYFAFSFCISSHTLIIATSSPHRRLSN